MLALSVLSGGTAFGASGNANPNAGDGQANAIANCGEVLVKQFNNGVIPDNGSHAGRVPGLL